MRRRTSQPRWSGSAIAQDAILTARLNKSTASVSWPISTMRGGAARRKLIDPSRWRLPRVGAAFGTLLSRRPTRPRIFSDLCGRSLARLLWISRRRLRDLGSRLLGRDIDDVDCVALLVVAGAGIVGHLLPVSAQLVALDGVLALVESPGEFHPQALPEPCVNLFNSHGSRCPAVAMA